MKSDQVLTKTAINVDDIIVKRNRDKVSHCIFFIVVMAMALWSINVTIIEDTDWERMGSLSEVLASAGRFIGIEFSLIPNLLEPAIETFMISLLGTLLGVIICIPATWFGALNLSLIHI